MLCLKWMVMLEVDWNFVEDMGSLGCKKDDGIEGAQKERKWTHKTCKRAEVYALNGHSQWAVRSNGHGLAERTWPLPS